MTSANVSQIPSGIVVNTQAKSAAKSEGSSTDFMSLVAGSLQNNQQMIDQTQDIQSPVKTEALNSYSMKEPVADKIPTKENETSLEKSPEEVDQVLEAADDFVQDVKKVISEEMEVSEEEIENAMATLGLNLVDLTDPANITKLLGELTEDETNVTLILDDTVSNILTEVEPMISDLFETISVSDNDEFANLLTANDLEVFGFEISKTPINLRPNGEVFGALEPKEEVLTDQILNSDPMILAEESNEIPQTKDTGIETPVEVEVPVVSQQTKVEAELENFDFEEVVEMEVDDKIITTVSNDTTSSNTNLGQNTSNQNKSTAFEQNVVADTSVNVGTPVHSQSNVSFTQTVTETTVSYTSIDVEDIMNQIVTQTRTVVAENSTTMELELHPASLGKMYLQVTENEGTISAKLYTQNHDVKAAMETQMVALKEAWNQQGLKVNSVEISVGTREFEEQLDNQAQTTFENGSNQFAASHEETTGESNRMRNINLNNLEDLPEDLSEEEILAASMMKDSGNSVNFTA